MGAVWLWKAEPECWLNWAGQHYNIVVLYPDWYSIYKITHEIVPLTIPVYFLPTQYATGPDNIIAITSLSLVIRPRHIRRVFTPELSEIGMIYRIALNFGGAKLWRISFHKIFEVLNFGEMSTKWITAHNLKNFGGLYLAIEKQFAKVWHHQSLALYGT